ncbi:hypothetical protein DFH06DRAFT_1089929 [Mycena polygramma]|nr:hypothetical protein DFH06DRAFT_1089929 [Mycena polygramma]
MNRPACHGAACGNFSSSLHPTPAQTAELMDILRSNAAPPDVEALQSTILTAPAELARYDAEIEQLQTVLAKLMSERGALAAYVDGCRSAFSPIRRLPTELLAEIFDICSPYCSAPSDHYLSESTTPEQEVDRVSNWHLLQLSQVSSMWHKIAMGTPKLWSTIVLDTSLWPHAVVSPATLLMLLGLSLERSGNHPLTVEAGVLEDDPRPHEVMSLLIQHAPQWEDMYFYSDLASSKILVSAKGRLNRLEKLNICADWSGVDIFEVAPRLTEVQFCGRVETVPDLPWAQITTFTYTGEAYMLPSNFLSLLGRCPNIQTFTSKVELSRIPLHTTMPSVSSDVQSLTFNLALSKIPHFAAPVVGHLFETLTLPSLQSLALTPRDDASDPDCDSPPVWHTANFLALAERSSFRTHLTRLELNTILTTPELLCCLLVLPLLSQLVLSDCTLNDEHPAVVTDTLLRGLIRRTDGPTLVPKLVSLEFTSLLAFSDSSYRDLIASRLPVGADHRFDTTLWWLPGRRREFPSQLLAELSHSDYDGDFRFTLGPFPVV